MTENSQDNSLKDRVKDWLKREGYPLEMRCARCFESEGFNISLGEYFNDPATDKRREIDIISTIRREIESEK